MADLEVWRESAAAQMENSCQKVVVRSHQLDTVSRFSTLHIYVSVCHSSPATSHWPVFFGCFLLLAFSRPQARRMWDQRATKQRQRHPHFRLLRSKAWISRLGRAASSHFHLMGNRFFPHLRAENCSRVNLFFVRRLIRSCLELDHRSQRQANRQTQSNWLIDGGMSRAPTASKAMHSRCELRFQIRVRKGLMSCRFV